MKTILETKRLYFREMNDDDFADLSVVINSNDHSYIQKWIDWCKSSYAKYGFGHYAVIFKENNEMIGSAGISMQPIDNEWKEEIGYHLKKNYQKIGLGKEVACALRDYFFNNFEKDEVYSYMNINNIASIKTAESMGMTFQYEFIDSHNVKCKIYKITRNEWKKLVMLP